MRNNIIKFISNVRGVIHISIYRMKYVISQGKLGVCPYQNLLPFLPLLCLSLQSHSLQSSIAAQRLSLRVETISPLKDLVLLSLLFVLFTWVLGPSYFLCVTSKQKQKVAFCLPFYLHLEI